MCESVTAARVLRGKLVFLILNIVFYDLKLFRGIFYLGFLCIKCILLKFEFHQLVRVVLFHFLFGYGVARILIRNYFFRILLKVSDPDPQHCLQQGFWIYRSDPKLQRIVNKFSF